MPKLVDWGRMPALLALAMSVVCTLLMCVLGTSVDGLLNQLPRGCPGLQRDVSQLIPPQSLREAAPIA